MTTHRTLIVDDTALIRRMLAQILSGTEFEVVGVAADGREAVEKFSELSPDFVLMDVMMPGVSGIEAVRQIIAHDPIAQIVMCSAYGEESVVNEALNAGAIDFIQKPFIANDVLETLREVAAGGGTHPSRRANRSRG